MQNNKKYLSLLVAIVLAMLSVGLASCEEDDDKVSGVSGLYYYDSGSGKSLHRTAYNFVNSNTVDIYEAMTSNANATWFGKSGVKFPLRSGWYYWGGNKSTHSYHTAGDMIVIGTDRIMTISGKALVYDDLGVVLYKWN